MGGVGSGKTVALCLRAYLLCYKYPGNRGMLSRYSYDEIRDSLLPTFIQTIPKEVMLNPDVLTRKDIASQVLLVRSSDPDRPSEILFRNLEDPNKFESLELGFFGISQANDPKVSQRMWQTLEGRLRWPVPYQYAFLEANYGGNASEGGWIWDLFMQQKIGDLWELKTLDNLPNLPPDYRARLASMPEEWKKTYVYGSWDPLVEYGGKRVYPEFSFLSHVPEGALSGDIRKLVTSGRPVIRGIDVPGHPACVWVQIDQKGRLLVAHELVSDQPLGIAEFSDRVQSESASFFPGATFVDYTDAAAFRVEQTSGQSCAQILFMHGLRPRPGPTQLDLRQQAVRDWLTLMVQGKAGLWVDPDCRRLIGGFQGGYYYARTREGATTGIPVKNDFCIAPETLILTADLRWIRADAVTAADTLYGCDELPHIARGGDRRGWRFIRKTPVLGLARLVAPRVRIETDAGPLVCSAGHPLLAAPRHRNNFRWTLAQDIKPGWRVAWIGTPWTFDESRDGGWLAGMYDGEGSLSVSTPPNYAASLGIAQNAGAVQTRIQTMLLERGYHVYVHNHHGRGGRLISCGLIRHGDQMRLLGTVRPQRLIEQFMVKAYDRYTLPRARVAVTAVSPMGPGDVIGIQTQTQTLMTNGFVSHNSHVHDALQYACSGIVRLQYQGATDSSEPAALARPTHWLGQLRR